MTRPVPVYLERQTRNPNLSGWARLSMWVVRNANEHGHARAYAGQLLAECDFTSSKALSQALEQARARGLIDQCSQATCIVLPGCAVAPCEARHREAP